MHGAMKYWLRSLLGMAICFACILGMTWALYHLVRTGTCASGGPYVSARPCPEGTGTKILVLMGCITGGLIGLGVYATRGGRGRGTVSLGIVMWALLFVSLAVATIVAAYGPASNDDPGARTAAVVLGIVFIPMGLFPLLAIAGLGPLSRRFGGEDDDERYRVPRAKTTITSGSPPGASPPAAAGDVAARLKQLDDLRAAGLVDDDEYESRRAGILDGV